MQKPFNVRCSLSIATLLAAVLSSTILQAQAADGRGTVKVMTYNLFQGTDFVEVLQAQSGAEFLAAVQTTLDEVNASNIPVRMQAIAHQIAITNPDLVGLEEVTLWRYGIGPNPSDVLYDPLQQVLDGLKAEGVHYSAVVVADEYELQGPMPDLTHYLRANGRNVILARTDKPELHISHPQSASFHTLLQIPSAVLGEITIVRSWGSVDVELNGQSFVFIDTHLENPIPQIPVSYLLLQAQAKELSDVPANTSLPVILVGDFNAIANDPIDPSNATYQEMLNLGFADSWLERGAEKPGLTWPLINSSTADTATQRIDFVFHRGLVNARVADVAGDHKQDRVDNQWPSDHAGLRALLQIGAQ
jgi:endonuclease/exonuclease/phosphatase family metal-dependent hydrolase